MGTGKTIIANNIDIIVFWKNDQLVLVGSEGDFHPSEVAYAEEVGFTTISLGPRILRAETAAFAAVVLAQQGMGNLSLR
jgi:16S rRNA (uracil1498-N3)-methyltransferase